jgi:hypothetical protein
MEGAEGNDNSNNINAHQRAKALKIQILGMKAANKVSSDNEVEDNSNINVFTK